MNIFEEFIGVISPRAAAERAYWRSMRANLSYEAARKNRHNEGWVPRPTSANAELGIMGQDLVTLWGRCRDLVRNDGNVRRAKRVLTTSIVGSGIIPRLKTNDRVIKKQVRDDFELFSDNCDPEGLSDFYGQMALLCNTIIESGAALVQWLPRRPDENAFPLQFRILEPDYFDVGKTELLTDGGKIIQGVEFNAKGQRVAYHLFDQHPGDAGTRGYQRAPSKRVSLEYFDHVFDRDHAGLVHGIPWITSVATDIKETADYARSENRRKRIESSFAAFITRNAGVASPLGKTEEKDGDRREKVKQGAIAYLKPGEEVKFGNPTHIAGYTEYMVSQHHKSAGGLGCTYEQYTGDLSRTNFSSLRGGLVDFYKALDHWQWNMIIHQFCKPAWRRFQNVRLVQYGDVGQGPAIWTTPKREMPSPDKDAKSDLIAIRMGRKTLQQVIAEAGEDPDEVLEQIAAANAQLDALGIVLDSDPRRMSMAGVSQMIDPLIDAQSNNSQSNNGDNNA